MDNETVEIIRAREAFLTMIADAVRWEEDGDEEREAALR